MLLLIVLVEDVWKYENIKYEIFLKPQGDACGFVDRCLFCGGGGGVFDLIYIYIFFAVSSIFFSLSPCAL